MGSPGLRGGPYLLLSPGTFGYSSSRADVSRFSCEVNGRGGLRLRLRLNSWSIMMFVILNNVNNNYVRSIHRADGGGAADPPHVASAGIKTTCLHPFLSFVYYSWLASRQVSANANLLPPPGNSSNLRGSRSRRSESFTHLSQGEALQAFSFYFFYPEHLWN